MSTPPPSLKGLIPELARMVGRTPAALYERQRVLVRAGLLKGVAGRGRGSGVRATPQAVALLLITLLATDSLTETEERTKAVMDLKNRAKRCPITGKKTFAEALTAILASEELAEKIEDIHVERSSETAGACIFPKGQLSWIGPSDRHRHGFPLSEFGSSARLRASMSRPALSIEARLSLPLEKIAHALTVTGTKEPNK